MDILILAGGQGSRLRTIFPDIPKPLAPINGISFIKHLMNYWITQGVSRFYISIGYKGEMIIEDIGEKYLGIPVQYIHEESAQGTGGAVLLSLEKSSLCFPFILLNGDTYFPVKINSLLQQEGNYVMALKQIENASRYGVVDVSQDMQVVSFSSPRETPALINGGVALVRQFEFETDERPLSLENTILPSLIAQTSKVFSVLQDVIFVDIGTEQGWKEACVLLKEVKP